MERVEQMKRDIVIVAVIVPLLLAAWVLAGPEKALAQSAAEDQYSSAATEQYADGGDQQVPYRLPDTTDPSSHTPPPAGPFVPADAASQTVPPDPSQIPPQGQDPSLAPSQDPSQNPDITQDPSHTPPPAGPFVPADAASQTVPPDPSQIPTPDQGNPIPDQASGIVEQIYGVVDQINGLIASLTGSSGGEGTQQQAQQAQQPQQVLQQMPQATPAPEAAQPLEADMGSSTGQMTDLLGQDVDPFWAQRFQGWAPYNSPNLVWYDQPTQTPCGVITPEEAGVGNGHNYCSTNETIYMSTPAAQTYAANWGNFANVYQLAHEQGHHVQNELGYFAKYKNDTIPGNSRAFENQADCFAGVWANSAYGQSKIGAGQIQEAIAAAEGLADDREIEQGATHGNAEDRRGWFMRGFNSGDPSTCAT